VTIAHIANVQQKIAEFCMLLSILRNTARHLGWRHV
jgi:hypothetical protein